MSTNVDALAIRRQLGREAWHVPRPHGPDGWSFSRRDGGATVIVSVAPFAEDGGREWVHASISHPDRDPSYAELVELRDAVFGDGYAVQVFVPAREHVNIHPHALHIWGRLDGSPFVPIPTGLGTI